MQLSDSKSVYPNVGKRKSKNTMGNDCLEHDVIAPPPLKTSTRLTVFNNLLKSVLFFCYPLSVVSNMNTPKKKNDLRESSYVMPYLLFTTALRSGMLQKSSEFHSQHWSDDSEIHSQALLEIRLLSRKMRKPYSVEQGPLTSCVRQYVWVSRFRI